MEDSTQVGMNRTGLDMAPLSKGTLLQFAEEQAGRAPLDDANLNLIRQEYAVEAERIGAVPLPASLKGMASTVLDKVKGTNPEVLLDKMGERLAYERTGVRLYEALLVKLGSANHPSPVDAAAVRKIHDDELSHVHLLAGCLRELGADPTAMTPCADVVGVAGLGHVQVLTDPRTTVAQALNSMLMIELGDNASWELLVELASRAGHTEMAERFGAALEVERQHLQTVQTWMREIVLEQAT